MSTKQNKKRNKVYRGPDSTATPQKPQVHRYTAVQRSAAGEWWHAKKKAVKLSAALGGGVIFIGWLLFEAMRITL